MDSEYQEKIEMLLEDIICFEASLIQLKHTKLQAEEEYKRKKAYLEECIKNSQRRIEILKQTGCVRSITDKEVDDWIEEEVEKECTKWKNLSPEEKIREHRERIGMLQKEEENWEPMTDIEVDRWIEEENEKEMERLEKLEAQKHD